MRWKIICNYSRSIYYNNVVVNTAKWFINYCQEFISCFLEELQRRFKSDNFKLTIEESGFTLELV